MWLKGLFIILLISFFIWKFAIPSLMKYQTAGVLVRKSWARRSLQDEPSITLCAINPETLDGWKTPRNKDDLYPLDSYCNNPAYTSDALKCFEEKTFNLRETIKENDLKEFYRRNVVTPDNKLWRLCFFLTDMGSIH